MSGGRRHELVVLDKDPLQDVRKTHSIRYVMKNGEILEGLRLARRGHVTSDGASAYARKTAPPAII